MDSHKMSSVKGSLKPLLISFLFLVMLEGIAIFNGENFLSVLFQSIPDRETFFPLILQIALWISGAFFITFVINHVILDRIFSSTFSAGKVPQLVKNIIVLLVFVSTGICIISFVFNKQVAGIWATSGMVGVLLGLALQGMIRDMFTGMAVNIDKPFVIGDFITLHSPNLAVDAGVKGIVQEINWRTTKLLTPENTYTYIPNSVIGTSTLTNHSSPSSATEIKISVVLAFSEDPERALRILESASLAVCNDTGPVLNSPPPKVRIYGMTPDGVEYRIAFMVARSPGPARDLLLRSLLRHMHMAGLHQAKPRYDIHIKHETQQASSISHTSELVELLHRIEIFTPLTKKELHFLIESARKRYAKKGETIFTAGSESPDRVYSMYILIEGLLYVSLDADDKNHEIQVGQIKPGDFFGEMSMLTGVPRSATVTAATDSVVYEIRQEPMATLLQQRPQLIETLSLAMAARRLLNEQAQSKQHQMLNDTEKTTLANQIFDAMKGLFGHIAAKKN